MKNFLKEKILLYRFLIFLVLFFVFGAFAFFIVGALTKDYIWFVVSTVFLASIFISGFFYKKFKNSKTFEAISLYQEGYDVDFALLNDKNVEPPVPSHLKDYLKVDEKKSNEKKLRASLICECDGEKFKIEKSTNHCVVKAVCQKCDKELTVFDSREHGFNSCVLLLYSGEPSGPFEEAKCKRCKENTFYVDVVILSEGKLCFIYEICQEFNDEDESAFKEDEWVNAFSRIVIHLKCAHCGKKRLFVNEETS